MDIQELYLHIDAKLDKLESRLERIEDKQDLHLDRISSAEASIQWLRGMVKFGGSLAIAIVSAVVTLIYNTLIGHRWN